MAVNAKHLVESLLEDEELSPVDGSDDPKERAYRRLHRLYTRRGELQSEQKWSADFHITLHRLGVDEDNIKSLDIRDSKLVGFWLKQGDYGAKIARKEKSKAARDQFMAAANNMDADEARQKAPKVPQEVSAYYVPVSPPLWVPEVVRNRL